MGTEGFTLLLLVLVLYTAVGLLFRRIARGSKRELTVWRVLFVAAGAFIGVRLLVMGINLREEAQLRAHAEPVTAEEGRGYPPPSQEVRAIVSIGVVGGGLLFALLLRWFLALQRREREAEAVGVEPPP